jgi:hypothetical protein
MNSAEFWDELELIGNLYERIDFIRTCKYDLTKESQPDAITHRFDDITTWPDACKIARALIYRYGNIIIAAESSACIHHMLTIVDLSARECHILIIAALKELGVHSAEYYAPKDLYLVYNHMYPGIPVNDYYNEIADAFEKHKEKMLFLHESLFMELMHPNRIKKWLDQGNDVNDYLP